MIGLGLIKTFGDETVVTGDVFKVMENLVFEVLVTFVLIGANPFLIFVISDVMLLWWLDKLILFNKMDGNDYLSLFKGGIVVVDLGVLPGLILLNTIEYH